MSASAAGSSPGSAKASLAQAVKKLSSE